jgi:hypothetical protein
MDQSKSDWLAKSLALLQTTWFICQIAERTIMHLLSTGLETMTVAFSVLNVLMYVFWWYKSKDVECPARIMLKGIDVLGDVSTLRCHSGSPSLISLFGDFYEGLNDDG